MGYRVRSPDGELHFDGIYEVEQAWLQGLVDSDDLVILDGEEAGIPAKDHPSLSRSMRPKPSRRPSAQTLRIALAVVLGFAAVIAWRVSSWTLPLRAAFVGVDFFLMAGLLTGVTRDAYRRRR